VLFAASLLSKAAAMGLPAVLLILDVYPLRRLGPGRWRGPEAGRVYAEKGPFVALSAAFLGLAVWARFPSMTAVAGHTPEARVARACYNVWFYLVKTVAPVRISACYPVPLRMSLAEPRFCLSALGLVAVSAALVVLRRRWPGALAAWAAYLVMLAPNSGLVQKGGQYVAADRYCLIPMMGLVALAASALASLLQRGRFRRPVASGVLAAGVVAGLVLVVRTREQCRTWHDSVALWSHAVAASTEPNPFACHSLGLALAAEPGRLAEARSWLAEALRIVPDDPSVHNAMTLVLARQGRIDEALAHARAALQADPDNVHARVNLGNVLAMKGDPAGAAASFESALRLETGNADAHGNLGLLLLAQGRPAEAEAHLAEALRLNPGMTQARSALENLRRRQGR
jgi:tetratricopeptide (TPR) repeat protein